MGLMLAAAIISCKDVTGPDGARFARGLSWNAIFPRPLRDANAAAAGLVDFNRVHVVLHHSDGSIALDTTISYPSGSDSLTVSLAVRLLNNAPASGEPMDLDLGYLNAAGDTVFKGGPIALTAAPPPAGGGVNPPVQVPVSYTGTGATATAVVIAPRTLTVSAGAPFTFTAAAKDASGTAIPGTPVIWTSLDPTIATVTSPTAGAGVALTLRGTAHILAQLITGAVDTVQLVVTLPAAQMTKSSGDAQTGIVSAVLGRPILVNVAASDGIAVAGTTVTFAVTSGGGSVSPLTAVTDANGFASATWTLGGVVGTQSATAAATGLTTVTFNATGTPAQRIWTGASSNLWTAAGNWLPIGIPTGADSVFIPATSTPPTLGANAAVRALVMSPGAVLTISSGDTLSDKGVLVAPTAIAGTGTVALVGAGTVTGLVSGALSVTGSYSLNGPLLVNGNVTISAGSLVLNGKTMTVSGLFCTQGTGTFTMNNALDTLTIAGSAKFAGGSTAGLLTKGIIAIGGDFLMPGAPTSFAPSGSNMVAFIGSAVQNVVVTNPGTATFQNFETANALGMYIAPQITIQGDATIGGPVITGAALTINGTLDDQGAQLVATSLVLGNASVPISAGTFGILSDVTFTGSAPALQAPLELFGGMTIAGGSLAVNGQQAFVIGPLNTIAGGTLKMTNATDSLLVAGQATFSGGAEAGLLTNGTLGILQGLVASGPGQFAASGNHVTLLIGPTFIGCGECVDLAHVGVTRTARRSSTHQTSAARVSASAQTGAAAGARAKRPAPTLAALRAKAKKRLSTAKTRLAALRTARQTLAANWPARAAATRAARTAGIAALAKRPTRKSAAFIAAANAAAAALRAGAHTAAARPAAGKRMSATTLQGGAGFTLPSFSDSAVYVAFADTTGNQFATVHVTGYASWQTVARTAGKMFVDTTGILGGNGHVVVGDTLFVSASGEIDAAAIELFGVLSDSGYFSPDTTIFSGTSQTLPELPCEGDYGNVVVNSPSLNFLAEDGGYLEINGSLFIMNSGQLRLGAPDPFCNSCEADELDVDGAFETHGSGTLRMNDANFPSLYVADSAYFAGGSSTGLLTQGGIAFYGNFRQGGTTPTAYVATYPHESYFDPYEAVTVTFANPGYGSSHFGDLYFETGDYNLASNVFADGSLETGCTECESFHNLHAATAGVGLTSRGASVSNIEFDGVTWDLQDGYRVYSSDNVDFEHQDPTAIQFSVERTDSLPIGPGNAIFSNWIFGTEPTSGYYVQVTQTDGPTTPTLTLCFINLSIVGFGHENAINNAIILGWDDGGAELGNAGNWIGDRLGVGGTSAGRAGTLSEGTFAPVTPLRALRF